MTDTAIALLAAMRDGTLSSESVVKRCLDVIDTSDADVQAWAYVDVDRALSQARAMDMRRAQGKALGKLHGLPVGLKDIIDTQDMPTQRGTVIHESRQPTSNALLVDKLLEQGAVILGKTVTTELAWMNESPTRNPHNLSHTPGGSSSGSAAAVASGQVPLAVGTQTGGSVIRPASFTGVYGYKPSRGLIPRSGVMQTSATLDQVGVFARDAGDAALLTDVLSGYDRNDTASYLAPRPAVLAGYRSEVPVEPHLAWIDMPYAGRFSDDLKQACDEVVSAIADTAASIERIAAPQSFSVLIECHKVIYDYEIFRCLHDEWTHHRDELSETTIQGLERAQSRSDSDYQEALNIMASADEWFETFFHDYDAIVTPAAIGEAPPLGQGTGDPINCIIWTLCGLPCLSMPLLQGASGLPIGLQLVGSYDRDDRLMRTARWLISALT